MIDQTELKALLDYDVLTGVFTWKVRTAKRVKIGAEAGAINDTGYRVITVYGKQYLAHRLAWLYLYSEWPKGDIDHINGNRTDNRIENLREATRHQNCMNKRVNHRNTSGYKGVSLHAASGKYKASCKFHYADVYFGSYSTPEEAARAYDEGVKLLYKEFSHLNFPDDEEEPPLF